MVLGLLQQAIGQSDLLPVFEAEWLQRDRQAIKQATRSKKAKPKSKKK
jgi:hypothetical protein